MSGMKRTEKEADLPRAVRRERQVARRRRMAADGFKGKDATKLTRKELDALTVELAKRAGLLEG